MPFREHPPALTSNVITYHKRPFAGL